MKTYVGTRDIDRCAQVVVLVNRRKPRRLPLRLDLDGHSPTGFEWGYPGSGPAQLALALLADALGNDQRALRLHQDFKWAVTAKLPQEQDWKLTEDEVRGWADALEKKRSA